MTETLLNVESIGVRGDGVAHHAGGRVFLAFTAPGDVVRARLERRDSEGTHASVLEIVEAGARAPPVCAHFGQCGGCALQHVAPAAYAAAKMAWLKAALKAQRVTAGEIAPLERLGPGTRRRARLAFARPRGRAAPAEIGFHARASHRIVDMRECAVLHPAIVALVAPLRALVQRLLPPGGTGAATVTLAETGIDLLIDLSSPPALDGLEALASFARDHDLARIAWQTGSETPVPAATLRPVRVVFAGVAVDLADAAFLQASEAADTTLAAHVIAAVGRARQVADLFAGLGTFTFPLARQARVHAVDGAAASIAALAAAAARAGLHGRVTSEVRDLALRPLLPKELDRFDAAVFDPPRAGAVAQARALAASTIGRVVAVSCNQATFARDARILIDGGLRLAHVQPVDSFLWSPHLEIVARFERG